MPAYEVITGPSPWPARYTFSPAVRAGNLLFISGMTAGDDTGQIVGPGAIVAQTRTIFEKFGRLRADAGAGFEHIVQTTEYVTTTENYAKTAAVRREIVKDRFPTATGVIVAGRRRQGPRIETPAIAFLPEHAPPMCSPLPGGQRAG